MKKYFILFLALLVQTFNVHASVSVHGNSMELISKWHLKSKALKSTIVISKPDQLVKEIYQALQSASNKQSIFSNEFYRLITNNSWELYCEFELPKNVLSKQHPQLIITDNSGFCSVSLNGKKLGQTENTFVSYSFDIKKMLRSGKNKLSFLYVPFTPNAISKSKTKKVTYPADNQASSEKYAPFIRYPQQNFGWDFTPPFPQIGFTSLPRIDFYDSYKVNTYKLTTESIESTLIKGQFHLEIESYLDQNLVFNLSDYLMPDEGGDTIIHLKNGINQLHFPFEIKNPVLWYPKGTTQYSSTTGSGNCFYYFEIIIQNPNSDETISISMEKAFKTISLIQEKDRIGQSFYFNVNGEPVFCKGVNLVGSPDQSVSDVHQWMEYLENSEINMVRIWGGGHYPNNDFLEFLDAQGILLWEDFMFAGTFYPLDSTIIPSIKTELHQQIDRISNHTCLALWCGNNEIEIASKNWGWKEKYHYTNEQEQELLKEYDLLFHQIIPGILKQKDPSTPYISSSPISNWGKAEESNSGNNHYWAVWHGEKPISDYANFIPRFVSEFGLPSFPSIENLKLILQEENSVKEQLKPTLISYKGISLLEKYIESVLKTPTDLNEWIYFSQYTQSYAAKKAWISYRNHPEKCGGALMWQLNDAAPVCSWSLLEYPTIKAKPAWYTTKNWTQNIVAIPEIKPDSIYVSLSHHTSSKQPLKVVCALYHQEKGWLRSDTVLINENETPALGKNKIIFKGNYQLSEQDKLNTVFITEIYSNEKRIFSDLNYFCKPGDFKFKKPDLHIEKKKTKKGSIVYLVKSNVLVDGFFRSGSNSKSENFMFLLPGIETEIYWDEIKNESNVPDFSYQCLNDYLMK